MNLKTKYDYMKEITEEMAKKSPFVEILDKIKKEKGEAIEEYCRLRIKSKPKWLPYFLWRKLLDKLLVMEYFENIN